jgi:hypothetical protein
LQLIHGLDQLCPGGYINQGVVESALRSGEFFLIPYGDATSPMLRQVITFNTHADQSNQQTSKWDFSSNTYSDHLTSKLNYLINQTPEPVRVAAAVRQKAKSTSSNNNQNKKTQQKEVYWIDLECTYKGAGESVEGMPYTITFSDGKTRKGKLQGGITRINDIPAGQVEVVFGYPEAEKELVAARKELQQCLDDIIYAVKERGSLLDAALDKENIGMQGALFVMRGVTGAFFDGLFGTLGDSVDGIEFIAKEMADTARVKLDQWDDIKDELKYEIIEAIEEKKETYLEFIAEIDEKRGSVEDALNKTAKQLKSDLEELASYADKAKDNAYAYGEESIEALTETYNHYALLFEDSEIGKMLKDFPGRYYDAMPKVEAAQSVGGAGFNVLTAVLTGGAAAAVVVAGLVLSKAGLFAKAGKTINKILKLLEKKKKTPDAAIKKPHNEVATAEVDKPKKEEVKKKDKKKCSVCLKAYNAKCPNANPKVKYPSETEGSGSALTKQILANRDNDYSKIEDHPWYFQRKQGSKNRRSIEAHHIIVSETMSNPDFKEMCEDFGYNINSYKNGVMLPYYMDLACHLGVALHRGGHDAGQGDPNLSYPRSVKKKVKSLYEAIDDGELCQVNGVSKEFKKEMNKISDDIFKKIRSFEWTITSDGFDYDNKKSKIGCGNQQNINDKDGSLCEIRSPAGKDKKAHPHEFPESAKDIKNNQRSILKIGH